MPPASLPESRRPFSLRLLRLLVWVLAVPGALLITGAAILAFRIPTLAGDLVCAEHLGASDAILIENFDPSYLVFERAADLHQAGLAPQVFVPVNAARNPDEPEMVSAGILEVMARVARLPEPVIIPIRIAEPISLNAAYQIRAALLKRNIRSVIVVAPAFRSRRSALVYGTVFAEAGIRTSCAPAFGVNTPGNWTRTWHGMQEVSEQYLKLLYYRLYVFPRLDATG